MAHIIVLLQFYCCSDSDCEYMTINHSDYDWLFIPPLASTMVFIIIVHLSREFPWQYARVRVSHFNIWSKMRLSWNQDVISCVCVRVSERYDVDRALSTDVTRVWTGLDAVSVVSSSCEYRTHYEDDCLPTQYTKGVILCNQVWLAVTSRFPVF